MAEEGRYEIARRYEGNPILRVEHMPFPCSRLFNAAVARHEGEIVLLIRAADIHGQSVLALARSKDGYEFEIAKKPVLTPARDGPFARYEQHGLEDPRLTPLDGTFYMVYTAVSDAGRRLALAKTDDFEHFERIALISEPDNKDGSLFPARFDGRYARLDRPTSGDSGQIWISYSPDLVDWGDARVVMPARGRGWDALRVGASVPPIEIDEGWLVIYHGVESTIAGPLYRLGAAVLDRDDPTRVLCRSAIPILAPREPYERMGDIPNVVYSCGAILEDGCIRIYYSGADTCIAIATIELKDLLRLCHLRPDD